MQTTIHDSKSHINDIDLTGDHILPSKSNENSAKEATAPFNTNTNLYTSLNQSNKISLSITRHNQRDIFYLFGLKFYRYLTPSKEMKRINLLDSEPQTNDMWIFA